MSGASRPWPDFRGLYDSWAATPGQPGFMTAWCHGAPGIGLSRVRAYALTGHKVYRREAEAALRSTGRALAAPAAPGQADYSLCHGSAGNAELLVYAARVFGDDSSRLLAEQVGHFGVEQYRKTLSPWPCGVLQGGETPGLLLGLAGIGHFYLRLQDPACTPSVLIILPEEEQSRQEADGRRQLVFKGGGRTKRGRRVMKLAAPVSLRLVP